MTSFRLLLTIPTLYLSVLCELIALFLLIIELHFPRLLRAFATDKLYSVVNLPYFLYNLVHTWFLIHIDWAN